MKSLPQLPEIPEEEQTPLVKSLLGLLEQYGTRVVGLEEAVALLKDEINILKGEKKRPDFKPSGMEGSSDKKRRGGSAGKKDKRAGSEKRSKSARLSIHEEVSVAPGTEIPPGSRFKGYRDFVVQDLILRSHNTRYRLERWITPEGVTLKAELPVGLGGRHFGPELVRFVLYQYHHCQTTQPLLLEQLREYGIDICAGQIEWILSTGHESLHEEKDALLRAGLHGSRYVTEVDDSGARHQGRNGYVTHIGNEWFAWFKSTCSKSRLNFLDLLRAGQADYRLGVDAIEYMERRQLPLMHVDKLRPHSGDRFETEGAWLKFLDSVDISGERHIRIATEGALLGSVLSHGFCHDLVIVSDDAGQFDVLEHALCWIHAERLVHKTLPLNEQHRQDIAQVRDQIWTLYADLKAFKEAPEGDRKTLAQRFDQIFQQQTSYQTLNRLLERIYANKDDLLKVLERPEIPLHTNGSERDIRDYVKKRKVSGGTRSDEGRRCRDTFISLKKTCRKLGISFWDFLHDRLCSPEPLIPQLSDLVRERASAPGY